MIRLRPRHVDERRSHRRARLRLGRLVALLAAALAGCETGPRDCFGIGAAESFTVRLVDDAESPTYYAQPGDRLLTVSGSYSEGIPSCAGFDDVAVSSTILISDTDLINRNPVNCSLVRADATLESGVFLEGHRDGGLWDEGVFTGEAALFTVISRNVALGGCSGTWVLDLNFDGLGRKYGGGVGTTWPREYLFDPGEAGGQAPVLAARVFLVDEGTSCPALGQATSCIDLFLARFVPNPP